MTLHISNPEPGFFQMRRVKGGVQVPVLVYRPCPMDPYYGEPLDRWRQLQCLVDGEESGDLERIWPYLRPITEAEYLYLIDLHDWARKHAPHLPEANTKAPIDLNTMSPIF